MTTTKYHQNQHQKEQINLFPLPLTASDHQNIRSAIRFYSEHCWSLPQPLIDNYFIEYKLLYWAGDYLLDNLTTNEGQLMRINPLTSAKKCYKLAFHRNLTRGKILADRQKQYALSFRIPAAKWNLPAIVLIGAA